MKKSDEGIRLDNLSPEPRMNFELNGHTGAENILKSALIKGQLPHAWLITGPRGIGKATLAYRFARYILRYGTVNLKHPEKFNLDTMNAAVIDTTKVRENLSTPGLIVQPEDPVSKRISSLSHADLLAIEKKWKDDKQVDRKTVISVEDVREVGSFLRMTPAEGGWRVVILDSADDMNGNAANALLKILEEPPTGALLLLISHNPGKLLATIRSRCRRLPLRPLPEDTLSQLVQKYVPRVGPDEISTLIRFAEGSIGRAIEMLEGGRLDLHKDVLDLLNMLPKLDITKLHKLGDALAKRDAEASFRSVNDLLRWMFSRVIRVAATGNPGSALSEREKGLVDQLSSLATLERWLEVWENVSRLLERAEVANLDRKQVILNVFHVLGQKVTR